MIPERILRRIRIEDGGCWLWTGQRIPPKRRYGLVWFAGSKRPAHRVLYELIRGSIPAGAVIDHLCRVPLCVNPDHLEAVTVQENNRRQGAAVTLCPNGHPYTDENTYVANRTNGKRGRQCRECIRVRQREWGRVKYETDPAYRQRVLARTRERKQRLRESRRLYALSPSGL